MHFQRPAGSTLRNSTSPASQIFGDFLELVDRRALAARQRSDRIFKAVIEVVLNERPLGLGDRLFDRMKLLGDIEAGAAALDHRNHGPQMTLGSLEPFGDFTVMLMGSVLFHWL